MVHLCDIGVDSVDSCGVLLAPLQQTIDLNPANNGISLNKK